MRHLIIGIALGLIGGATIGAYAVQDVRVAIDSALDGADIPIGDIYVEDTKTICIYPHPDISTEKHCLDTQEAWRLIDSYADDGTGEIMSRSCEKTWANSEVSGSGVQRFLVYAGPDHETVCKERGFVTAEDCEYKGDVNKGAEWRKPMVRIDYQKQHEICVYNMYSHAPKENNPPKEVCFDLYDMGER